MTDYNDSIPHLNIEALPSGLIRLENESMGESYAVDVHPMQLRLIAEKLGLIAEVSATDAELLRTERGRLAEILRTQERYKRGLLHIRSSAERLYENVYKCSQQGNEDLGVEVAQAAALCDFTDHICTEFEAEFDNKVFGVQKVDV